jgi:glycosyltransferase A (GT-A) superfamily protein (DUF2064 family)
VTHKKEDSDRVAKTERKARALILFTKAPTPGFVKTRFIGQGGGLSEEQASSLYVCLLEDTLAAAADLAKKRVFSLIVSFAPKKEKQLIQSIVAPYFENADFVPQAASSVTQNVRNAFDYAFGAGYEAVSLIPGDHPDLNCDLLAESFDYLTDHHNEALPSAVLGPTCDGGAYLLGFNRKGFSRIRFRLEDTFMVCASIVRSARDQGVRYVILDNRSDIDDWEDAKRFLREAEYTNTKTHSFLQRLSSRVHNSEVRNLSIIIPTLNEERAIGDALTSLDFQTNQDFETILVDGNSSDLTLSRALGRVDKIVLVNHPSRKRQENIGAMGARGDTLLFLHADMKLPSTMVADIAASLKDPTIIGGSSPVAFDGNGFKYRFLDALRGCGSRLLHIHGISSAFFVRSSMFFTAGGFREEVMEEAVDLVRRLAGNGKFITLNRACVSSARRFKKHGFRIVAVLWIITVLLTIVGLHITWFENKFWRGRLS